MHISRPLRSVTAGILFLIALVPATSARGQLLRIIDDPRREAAAEFGWALASVGGDFAVGAPGASIFGSNAAGRVQLFAANGSLRRTFQALTPVPGARLGTALVADAGRLYASAPGDRPIGIGGLGAVHVFDVASGAVIRVITAPDPNANTVPIGGTVPGGLPQSTGPRPIAQGFGHMLVVADDRIVVGAPDSVVRGLAGAGAVYVFDRDGALVRTLQDPTPAANAFFGTAVAVIGDALFVGVPGAISVGVAGGVVKVFDAATGAFRRTLSPPISRDAAEFGTVVGQLDGELFASAPGDRNAAGAVYLFGAGATRLDRILTPPTSQSQPGADFGGAVLAVGDNLLVGADGTNDASGEAFLIEPVSSALVARFLPTVARAGGRFGFALAAAGPVIAIGEPATGDSAAVGRVYLFGPSTTTPPTGPGPTQPTASAPPAGVAARCPLGATTASVDCRLAVLLGALRDEGLSRLAGPLRRAGRDVRRADTARGTRRIRALGRAARSMGQVASRLESGRESTALAAETRAALVAEASTVRSDLLSLVESGPR